MYNNFGPICHTAQSMISFVHSSPTFGCRRNGSQCEVSLQFVIHINSLICVTTRILSSV